MDEETSNITATENVVSENIDTNNLALTEDRTNNSDEFVYNKLKEWDLLEYIEIFKQERIDKISFFAMSENDVKLLIKPMGHYLRFILERRKLTGSSYSEVSSEPSSPYENGCRLRKLLLSSPNGKYILRNSPIGPRANDLATLIINHLLNRNPQLRITKKQFELWSKEIGSLWPQQAIETWYKPAANGRKASGKLYYRYTNTLKKIKPTISLMNEEENEKFDLTVKESAEQFINELNNCNIDNQDRILVLWEKTHVFRRSEPITISQYFNTYPQLNPPFGRNLIELDFHLLKLPIDSKSLERKWMDLHLQILEIASEFPVANKRLQECTKVHNLPTTLLAWKVLPYLFKPTLKKGKWKPSIKEQSDSFILWLPAIADIEAGLKNQAEFMREKNCTLQPMIVAVGPPAKLDAVYVIVDEKKFQFDDVTNAVAFCWKLIYALNARYSEVCDAIWVFIERYIYKYSSEKSIHYQSVDKVINYLNQLNARSNESI